MASHNGFEKSNKPEENGVTVEQLPYGSCAQGRGVGIGV